MKQQEMQGTWTGCSNDILCYQLGSLYEEADFTQITVNNLKHIPNGRWVECFLKIETPGEMEIKISPNWIRGKFDQALTDKQSEYFGLSSSIKALEDIQKRIAENIAILKADMLTYTDIQCCTPVSTTSAA